MSIEKVYCRDCAWKNWGSKSTFCNVGINFIRGYGKEKCNKDNKCENYKRKWYKFWLRG